MADAPVTYARRVGLFTGVMMVIGGIIGSGIFRSPQVVAQRVLTGELTLLAWALGGLIALAGAFVYAELGARMPRTGGQYVYLRDALGPLPAFLYGWALLLVIAPGAIAAVGITFADYLLPLVGGDPSLQLPVVVGTIAFLSAINYVGVTFGAVTQNIFTVLKLAALAALVAAGLGAAAGLVGELPTAVAAASRPANVVTALSAALVPVLFSYGGWQQTNFVAEEIIAPERNLPKALLLGVLAVVVVYLLANLAYLSTLGSGGLAASSAPAADTMRQLIGPEGETLIAAGIAVSTFGFIALVILVTPRVLQAMAADGLFLPLFGRLHPRYRTPGAAIAFVGAWSIILALSGKYGALLDYVVFADWIFFSLTGVTLLVYRARERRGRPAGEPGFRAPLHPVLPLLFVLAGIYVVFGSVASNPGNAIRGAVILAVGVPVYLYHRKR